MDLTKKQSGFLIFISIVLAYAGFTLANAPFLSPFAFVLPNRFLYWHLWNFVGNILGVTSTCLLGFALRTWNEKKNEQDKQPKNVKQYKQQNIINKKKKKEIQVEKNGNNLKKESNIPRQTSANIYSFQTQKPSPTKPLSTVNFENNRTETLTNNVNFFPSPVVTPKQTKLSEMVLTPFVPARPVSQTDVTWAHSIPAQQYYPSAVSPKQKPDIPSFEHDHEKVLKSLNLDTDELLEKRTAIKTWLSGIVRYFNSNISDLSIAPPFALSSYITQRISALAEDVNRNYNRDTSPDQPSDAQILMKIFCARMDQLRPAQIGLSFTTKHYISERFSPDPSNVVELAIYQSTLNNNGAQYSIIHKNEVKKICEGNNNLFDCLIVFIEIAKSSMQGQFPNQLLKALD